jgi:exonuclease VII small subunit|tara:strand:- start:811 stop:1887 length:1077 start_codon:yes stop_codon:yes gene_type:complete
MNKDLPVFDITIADIEQGMFKISLVDKPAIEENFIYFSKEEQILFATDKEKREVIGPIMIPDKEIIRYSPDMGYYYVRFSEEIIKEIMYKYSKEGLFNAFGINHSYDTDEVVMLEVWMKEGDSDKSQNYGYDLPNGTVFVKAKIESDELFTAIKDGEINGFSIEIKADIKPSNNIEENMNEFAFAKELGKMEAQFESSVSTLKEKVESLENENAVLLEAMTSFEDKFAGIEDLKGAIDMIQKHIESMSSPEEEILSDNEEVMEDTPEKSIAPVGDSAIEMEESKEEVVAEAIEETFNETKVEEEFSTEEEVNEKEVEEQFAAEQKAEDAPEVVEDTTVVFDAITPEKVDMINNFFNRK